MQGINIDDKLIVNYFTQNEEVIPSVFRESDNFKTLISTILQVLMNQQYDLVWLSQNLLNVDLAVSTHLDLIGGIVGQNRFLVDFNTENYFGFQGSYNSDTFGSKADPRVGGYWRSRSHFNKTTARRLNDDEYRRIIKARAIYNQSFCTADELVEVVNLITGRNDNRVQLIKHGLIKISTSDKTGLLSYFTDRFNSGTVDNILPIAAGVRINVEEN